MQMYNVKKYFWCKMSCLNIPSFKNFEIHIFQSSSHARPISFGRIVCKLCRAGETCAKTLTGFEFLWAYSSARWQALPCRNVVGWPHSCTVYLFTIFEKSQWVNITVIFHGKTPILAKFKSVLKKYAKLKLRYIA